MEAEWRQVHFDEDRVLNAWLDALPMLVVVGLALVAPVSMIILKISKRTPSPASNSPR
jgi:hypothetical protein